MSEHFVDWNTMERFVSDVFKGYGVPEEDARICTDVLLESDRLGIESHGVRRGISVSAGLCDVDHTARENRVLCASRKGYSCRHGDRN